VEDQLKKQWIFSDSGWEQITSEWVAGKLWVHYQGETRVFDPESERKRFLGGVREGGGQVIAPMPGKVTKVFVALGEKVQAGQALVVMEAMKMEYTLKAEISGCVRQVLAKEGQQVGLGQALVKIDPENEVQVVHEG
jgi:biotin carboxyl carrier protein